MYLYQTVGNLTVKKESFLSSFSIDFVQSNCSDGSLVSVVDNLKYVHGGEIPKLDMTALQCQERSLDTEKRL